MPDTYSFIELRSQGGLIHAVVLQRPYRASSYVLHFLRLVGWVICVTLQLAVLISIIGDLFPPEL